MNRKFALFDFDNTLCRGDSILPFLLYCIRKGAAPKRQLLKAGAAYVRQLLKPGQVSYAKGQALSFIQGKSQAEMDELCRGFFREALCPRFFRQGVAEVTRLHEEGYVVLVVSASAELYMRLLPEFMPVDAVLATRCGLDAAGRYTGQVDENCKGVQKPLRIAEYLAAHHLELDYDASRAYGDSPSDIPMLQLAACPTLVNPGAHLKRGMPQAAVVTWR